MDGHRFGSPDYRIPLTGRLTVTTPLTCGNVDRRQPSREATNGLYASVGFERRETNVYRHQLATLPSGQLDAHGAPIDASG